MRIDWGRLILFWLVLYVAQIVISMTLATIGVPVNSYAFVVLFDICLAFVFTYMYYPSYARRGLFRDPDFYKNAMMFFLILFAFDMLF